MIKLQTEKDFVVNKVGQKFENADQKTAHLQHCVYESVKK